MCVTKQAERSDRTGQDRTGRDGTGQDRTGQDRTGQDRTGQDRTGQDRTGQDRTGQDRTGQVRSGQVRSGQDRTGQDRSGQVRSGQVRSGQDRTGQDRTGQDRTGKDRTGPAGVVSAASFDSTRENSPVTSQLSPHACGVAVSLISMSVAVFVVCVVNNRNEATLPFLWLCIENELETATCSVIVFDPMVAICCRAQLLFSFSSSGWTVSSGIRAWRQLILPLLRFFPSCVNPRSQSTANSETHHRFLASIRLI